MHGVTPIIGRDFVRDDTDPNSPLVALLGYGYWQSHYGGRGMSSARPSVSTPTSPRSSACCRHGSTRRRRCRYRCEFLRRSFRVEAPGASPCMARLRPDVTIEQARARLSARMVAAPRPDGTVPDVREVRAVVTSVLESATSQYRTTVNVLAGAVGLILLIACVNVAGLLLARGAARQSELAVRASLGAGRGRLIRQLLTESVVLALPGGAIGVLLAWLSLDAIVANIPLSLPKNSPVALNLSVLAATAALLVPTDAAVRTGTGDAAFGRAHRIGAGARRPSGRVNALA